MPLTSMNTQEIAPVPIAPDGFQIVNSLSEYMSYCGRCDSRIPENALYACENDGEWLCSVCVLDHVHNGDMCEDCGFRMINNGETLACRNCDVRACRDHFTINHTGCADGGYDGADDGRYTGRPPVDGFGREAYIGLIDAPYFDHPLASGRRAAALELEVEYKGDRTEGRMFLPADVGIGHDGSLSNGIEVTTPPARGLELASVVLQTCQILSSHNYVAEETCGMHTHIDLRNRKDDKKFLSHLFNAFFSIEDILYAMQSFDRHNNTYSVPLRNNFAFFDMYGQRSGDFDYTFYRQPKTIEGKTYLEREKSQKYASPRYAAFNFHSVYFRGSLECRLHEGTVDGENALRWIDLLQTIIARVERGHSYSTMQKLAKMSVTRTKVARFAKYFGLSEDQREYVIRRINGGQGFGFALPHRIVWGTPVKGRPKGEPRPVYRRPSFIGHAVTCMHCNFTFTMRDRMTYCNSCMRPLHDRWGDRQYSRATTRLNTNNSVFATADSFQISNATMGDTGPTVDFNGYFYEANRTPRRR